MAAVTCFVFAALFRQALSAIAAAAVLLLCVGVQGVWYYGGTSASRESAASQRRYADVRVLSSNLRKGQADADFLTLLAKDQADVVAVSELTPEEVGHFARAGLQESFPYSVLGAAPDAGGIGLFSRYPLITGTATGTARVTAAAAEVAVPGVSQNPVVASVHVISPLAGGTDAFTKWRESITATKSYIVQLAAAADPGAVIVGGDFNSTPDMWQFRDLLTNGYRDAVQQTGSGFSPTFPVHDWVPPLITIDHVLTRNASASSIKTVTIPGSDHRALLATIQVPLDPTAS
ncbi:endonuclease/exonuclease/phosphatase family protein [Mycobacterium sp. WMMD1722]|uniref:endonuclease/exonuclease/phosphatase family protein n=1 Tax=Mycobacterium sp. WMMD1722 TaxID=3404117 RepID=UPI003BF4CCF9